jgi:hypothetical protein
VNTQADAQDAKGQLVQLVVQHYAWYAYSSEIIVNGSAFQPWKGDKSIAWSSESKSCLPLRYRGKFDQILAIGSEHGTNWYHFMMDMFAFLLWIPTPLRLESHFVFANVSWRPGYFVPATLQLLHMNKIVALKQHEVLFASQIYFFFPFQSGRDRLYCMVVTQFRRFMVKKFDLDLRIPWRFWLGNRGRRCSRHIANMPEVLNAFRLAMSKYVWEIVLAWDGSLESAAHRFNTVKLFLAVHGAGNANIVFMQVRSVFVEIQSLECFQINLDLTRAVGLYHIVTVIGKHHWTKGKWILSRGQIAAMIPIVKSLVVTTDGAS